MKRGGFFFEMYDVKLFTMKYKDRRAIYVVTKVRMGCLLERRY